MTPSHHAHDVLHMILDAGSFTQEGLMAAIEERFGADARFHTCSMQDLDAEALVDFFQRAGKVTVSDGTVAALRERMCDH